MQAVNINLQARGGFFPRPTFNHYECLYPRTCVSMPKGKINQFGNVYGNLSSNAAEQVTEWQSWYIWQHWQAIFNVSQTECLKGRVHFGINACRAVQDITQILGNVNDQTNGALNLSLFSVKHWAEMRCIGWECEFTFLWNVGIRMFNFTFNLIRFIKVTENRFSYKPFTHSFAYRMLLKFKRLHYNKFVLKGS